MDAEIDSAGKEWPDQSHRSFKPQPAQVATAWAIAKGTLPIIGVTKVKQAEEAAAAARIVLTTEEVSRLEKLSDEAGVPTLREWEKEMI